MKELLKYIYYAVKRIKTNLLSRNVHIGRNTILFPGTLIDTYVKIGRNCEIDGEIGSYSYMGDYCSFKGVKIGKYCSIASSVKVLRSTHPTNVFVSSSPVFFSTKKQCGTTFAKKELFDERLRINESAKLSCVVGNDVWIGENAIIMGGVTIGNGAVIAAGAVVTKDVLPYSIVGGVPAHEIRKRFSEDTIGVLENSQWWDWPDNIIKERSQLFGNVDLFVEYLKEEHIGD